MSKPTEERLAAQLERPEVTSGNVGHAGSGTQPEYAPHVEDHGDDHTHHVPMSAYYAVFGFLMLMLLVTVGAWWVDQFWISLGPFSVIVALIIAFMKAGAIVLIFMHVKYSSRLVQIFACTGLVFAAILFVLTFNDYGTRHWLPDPGITASAQLDHPVK